MCELLEIARAKQGNVSYYEIAKRLKVSDQLVRKWKDNKSQPNGLNSLKLADMAGVTPKEAIKLMESGNINVSLLIMTSFATTLTAALVNISASLYIMLNGLKRQFKLHRFSVQQTH